MPEDAVSQFPVQLAFLALRSAQFERTGSLSDDRDHEITSDISLGVVRLNAEGLALDLVVTYQVEDVMTAKIAYRGGFERGGDLSTGDKKDAVNQMREFAARVAPTVLYPYVREALTSLMQRADLPTVALPILNFGNVFDPADLELPEPVEAPEPAPNEETQAESS